MKLGPVLHDSFLRCLTPEKRRELGQKNKAEVLAAGELVMESTIQKQVLGLLATKGIEVLSPRFGKKTRMKVGWPDITFAVQSTERVYDSTGQPYDMMAFIPVVWELKRQGEDLEPHQRQMAARLMSPPNGWYHATIHSVDEAIQFLRDRGID